VTSDPEKSVGIERNTELPWGTGTRGAGSTGFFFNRAMSSEIDQAKTLPSFANRQAASKSVGQDYTETFSDCGKYRINFHKREEEAFERDMAF